MNSIDYEQLYMETLYHYLAEIHFINKTDIFKKEEKKENLIKDFRDKIYNNLSSYKDNKEKIIKINELIINIEEENNIEKFNNELIKIITK
jgi:hypothetical protein